MEQFTIPLASFDVTLLPEEARGPGSPNFAEAAADFFRRQLHSMGVNGAVTVSPERIEVGWIVPGFDPIAAGIEKLRRGQLREGAQLLELARSRHPNSTDLLFNLGVARSELGEPDQAIPILTHLLAIAPGHIHGLVALGVALGRSGRNQEALAYLSKAVELAPADAWSQKNMGAVLFRLNRAADARVHLEAAVQLAPDDAQASLLLGEVCLTAGDTVAARQAFLRARTLDPHGPARDRADAALNRLADIGLPRNAEGVNPQALAAMTSAIGRLHALPPEAAKNLTLKAALLGQNGLRLTDPSPAYRLEGIEEPLSGLEVACLIHAGVQLASPGADTGLPLKAEYHAVVTRQT